MKELIQVINQDGELLVSARDLHKALESKERFSKWFDRMCEYGFEEGMDFKPYQKVQVQMEGSREVKRELEDYALNLDTAKQICMIQKNDLGRAFRKYFIECENALRTQQQPLRIETSYSYSNYWIKRELNSMKPTDIPDYIENLINAAKDKKPNDRLITYQVARSALEDIQPTLIETWQREMVQASLNKLNNLIELQKTYINRTRLANKTKKINQLENRIKEYDGFIDVNDGSFFHINRHAFTANRLTDIVDGRKVNSNGYRTWLSRLNLSDFLPDIYPNVDFTRTLKLTLCFESIRSMDLDNQVKAIQDALASYYGFEDNLIDDLKVKRINTVDTYEEGKIHIKIENIDGCDENDR